MHRMLPLLPLLLAPPAAAQLLVRQPVDLGTIDPGQVARCDATRCGVVLHQHMQAAGALFEAAVTAAPLRSGPAMLHFAPSVVCLDAVGRACAARRTGGPLRWGLGATVATDRDTPAGRYQGLATLVVLGPHGAERLDVPVTLTVREAAPACGITQDHALRFGRAAAGHAGSITLDPARGTRTATGGHALALDGSYSMPTMRIATDAAHVLIAVDAPGLLQGAHSAVEFTGTLAWRHRTGAPYQPALGGAGSIILQPARDGTLDLRLGGRVRFAPAVPPGHYRGTVLIRYLCY